MKPSKIEILKFSMVMLVFLVGMVYMLINKIENVWIWIGYISLWTWAEAKAAKNIHIKPWAWVLIIALILLIDAIVIFYFM